MANPSLEELGTGFLCVGNANAPDKSGKSLPVIIYLDTTGEQKAQLIAMARQQSNSNPIPHLSASVPKSQPSPSEAVSPAVESGKTAAAGSELLSLTKASPEPQVVSVPQQSAFSVDAPLLENSPKPQPAPSSDEFDPLALFKEPVIQDKATSAPATDTKQAKRSKDTSKKAPQKAAAPASEPQESSGRRVDFGTALPF
jgi:hypothetical protein